MTRQQFVGPRLGMAASHEPAHVLQELGPVCQLHQSRTQATSISTAEPTPLSASAAAWKMPRVPPRTTTSKPCTPAFRGLSDGTSLMTCLGGMTGV